MLLNRLALTRDTTVVFVGDYVDRGPNAREVIDTVIELREQVPVVALMGNHEAMFLDFLDDPYSARAGAFIYNGGSSTLASYADAHGEVDIPPAHIDFLRSLRLYWESEHAFFVHAGVPTKPLDSIDPVADRAALLWIRRPFLSTDYRWSKVVVHGHTPVRRVTIRPNRINIDTGCVFRRRLSAIALPGDRVFSVPRQRRPRRVLLRDVRSQRAAVRFRGIVPVRVTIGDRVVPFETVDYSEIGMYIRDLAERDRPILSPGDRIAGTIGPDAASLVEFVGQVVRHRRDDRGDHYGVRVLSSGPSRRD